MNNKRIFIVLCLLIFILSCTFASAADDSVNSEEITQTSEINETISQSNHESASINEADSNVMANSASENDKLCAANNDVLGDGEKTFSDLQNLIDSSEGEISLTDNYKFTTPTDDGYTEGIIINKDLTIKGNGKYIDGSDSSRIFKVSTGCGSLILKNLTFKNAKAKYGGAILWEEGEGDLNLSHVNFIGNHITDSKGGAIFHASQHRTYWETNYGFIGNIYLDHCLFKDNSAYNDNDRYYPSTGGAIFATSKIFNATDCEFINNSGHGSNFLNRGGAIALESSDIVIFSNCNFINNTEKLGESGAISILVDDVHATNVIINGGLFTGNTALEGGVIGFDSKSYDGGNYNLTIRGVKFINNTADSSGGVIYSHIDISDSSILDIQDCTFINNTLTSQDSRSYGGAIYSSVNVFILKNSEFDNCMASSGEIFGGIICNENHGTLNATVENITVTNINVPDFSDTEKHGLIMYLFSDSDARVNLKNFNLTNIKSEFENSGDMYLIDIRSNNGAVDLTVENLNFINNTAGEGCINVEACVESNVTLKNIDIIDNSLNNAIQVKGNYNGNFLMENVHMLNNTFKRDWTDSKQYPHLISTDINNLKVNNCDFVNNHQFSFINAATTNINITNCIFTNQSEAEKSEEQWAFNFEFCNNVNIYNCNISNIYNCEGIFNFNNNRVEDNCNLTIKSVNFINNTLGHCTININVESDKSDIIMSEIEFINNKCGFDDEDHNTKYDCAINFKQSSGELNLNINNLNFINNTGKLSGAIAIEMDDSENANINITNTNFINNEANSAHDSKELRGGAVCISGSSDKYNLNVDNVQFGDNSIKGSGGALYIDMRSENANVNITNTNFTNNEANGNPDDKESCDGGAVYISGSSDDYNLNVDNVQFEDNAAKRNGGALYMDMYSENANVNITNTNFTNNEANGNPDDKESCGGGAVYISGSSDYNLNVDNVQFEDNTAKGSGGALLIATNSGNVNVNITNTDFINNEASGTGDGKESCGGGAVYISGSSDYNLNVDNVQFEDNTAKENGGALYINMDSRNANVNITNTNFTNNEASGSSNDEKKLYGGGAILSQLPSDATMVVDNVNFINNSAVNGGAISTSSGMSINNTNFTGNHPLYYNYEKTGIVQFNITPIDDQFYNVTVACDIKFTKITINSPNGDIKYSANIYHWDDKYELDYNYNIRIFEPDYDSYDWVEVGIDDIDNYRFEFTFKLPVGYDFEQLIVKITEMDTDNIYYDFYKSEEGYAKGFGGAIYCQNGDENRVTINNSNFRDNYMDNGGAIFLHTDDDFDFKCQNVNFTGNSANISETSSGGAIGVYDDSYNVKLNLIQCAFENNAANQNGGAVYANSELEDRVNLTVTNSSFTLDTASKGGAIYANNFPVNLIDTKFDKNKADSKNLTYSIEDGMLVLNFTGWENHVNGIYSTIDSVTFTITHYEDEERFEGEYNQTIVIEIYDSNNELKDNVTLLTNVTGQVSYNINKLRKGTYSFKAYHPDNEYYTYIERIGEIKSTREIEDVNLTVKVENIKYGNNATVYVTLKDMDGNNLNATVNVTVNNVPYTITVTDGKGSRNITGLAAKDNYLANATFKGNESYASAESTDLFNVTKAESTLTADNITFIYGGSNSTVVVYSGASGFTANIAGHSEAVSVNGNVITVSTLGAGNYTLNITTIPDENHTAVSVTVNITVYKAPSLVKIDPVTSVDWGNPVNVGFNVLNKTAVTYIVKNADGSIAVANTTIDGNNIVLQDLSAGDYTIFIANAENDNYTGFTADATFTVNKIPSTLTADNITFVYGGSNSTNVVYSGATGVSANIAGHSEAVSVDGNVVTVSGLGAGNYTLNIATIPDENHTSVSATVNITVYRAGSDVEITAGNVTYPGNVNVSVKITNDTVVTYVVKTVDGVEVITNTTWNDLTNNLTLALAAGNYTITVANAGNENITGSVSSLNFTVKKAESTLTADNITFIYGGSNSTNVVYSGASDFTANVAGHSEAIVNIENNIITVSGLGAGNYTLNIATIPDENHTAVSITVNITVYRAGSDVEITAGNVTYPGNVNVSVKINNNTVVTYVVKTVDGVVVIANTTWNDLTNNLTLALAAGNYTITVANADNENITGSVSSLNFTVKKAESTLTADNIIFKHGESGNTTVTSAGASDFTANVSNHSEAVITIENNIITVSGLAAGNYTLNITTVPDENHTAVSKTVNVTVVLDEDYSINVNTDSPVDGENATVTVEVPQNANGTVTVTLSNGTNYTADVKDGKATVNVPNLPAGDNNVTVTYSGDDHYADKTTTSTIHVKKIVIDASDMKRGWDSPYDYLAKLIYDDGKAIANKTLVFNVDGNQYNVTTDDEGVARLADSKLSPGKYTVTVTSPLTSDNVTAEVTIVARIIENRDLTKDYESSKHYTVTAIADDGNPEGAGVTIVMKVNGVTYKVKTDKKGHATLKIRLNPKKYTITATYHKYTVKNKITVKQTLKLVKKTVKVKKGKKILLKAKLKWSNGKAIKGKVIKFKFKGKTYKAKTNSKGVAKITVKNKKILKKLKKGKTYKFTATYIKNNVKGKVKIKK